MGLDKNVMCSVWRFSLGALLLVVAVAWFGSGVSASVAELKEETELTTLDRALRPVSRIQAERAEDKEARPVPSIFYTSLERRIGEVLKERVKQGNKLELLYKDAEVFALSTLRDSFTLHINMSENPTDGLVAEVIAREYIHYLLLSERMSEIMPDEKTQKAIRDQLDHLRRELNRIFMERLPSPNAEEIEMGISDCMGRFYSGLTSPRTYRAKLLLSEAKLAKIVQRWEKDYDKFASQFGVDTQRESSVGPSVSTPQRSAMPDRVFAASFSSLFLRSLSKAYRDQVADRLPDRDKKISALLERIRSRKQQSN